MNTRTLVALALSVPLCIAPLPLRAQHGSGAPAMDTKPPRDASQFAFLVGQWDVSVKPKATTLAARIHGVPAMHGTWKAWRAFEGWGIQDELRIVDDAGNPRALTHFARVYDAAARKWNVSALDVYRGKFTLSNAAWQDDMMRSTTQGIDADGKPYTSRVSWSKITPASFRYQQDRSTDGGRTWTESYLVIDGKRTAAVAPR